MHPTEVLELILPEVLLVNNNDHKKVILTSFRISSSRRDEAKLEGLDSIGFLRGQSMYVLCLIRSL